MVADQFKCWWWIEDCVCFGNDLAKITNVEGFNERKIYCLSNEYILAMSLFDCVDNNNGENDSSVFFSARHNALNALSCGFKHPWGEARFFFSFTLTSVFLVFVKRGINYNTTSNPNTARRISKAKIWLKYFFPSSSSPGWLFGLFTTDGRRTHTEWNAKGTYIKPK